jgi:hypothetical protein
MEEEQIIGSWGTDWTWKPEPTVDLVTAIKQINGHTVKLEASHFRLESNLEDKATISIYFDTVLMDQDQIRLNKRTERNGLVNSAYKQLPTLTPGWTDIQARSDVMNFCNVLLEKAIEGSKSVLLKGTPAESRRPAWILENYVMKEAGSTFFAPPGVGKSYLGMTLATLIQHADSIHKNDIWQPEKQANVLYINLERNEKEMQDRLAAINESLGLPFDKTGVRFINQRGLTLARLKYTIKQEIHDWGIEVIVLDSLSRTGASLIDDTAVNEIFQLLNSYKVSYILLAHSPRADASHPFGSQMSSAAVDAEYKMTSYQDQNVLWIEVHNTKANGFRKGTKEYLKFNFGTAGFPTEITNVLVDGLTVDAAAAFGLSGEEVKKEVGRELRDSEINFIKQQGHVTVKQFGEHFNHKGGYSNTLLQGSKHVEIDEAYGGEQPGSAKWYRLRQPATPMPSFDQHPLL